VEKLFNRDKNYFQQNFRQWLSHSGHFRLLKVNKGLKSICSYNLKAINLLSALAVLLLLPLFQAVSPLYLGYFTAVCPRLLDHYRHDTARLPDSACPPDPARLRDPARLPDSACPPDPARLRDPARLPDSAGPPGPARPHDPARLLYLLLWLAYAVTKLGSIVFIAIKQAYRDVDPVRFWAGLFLSPTFDVLDAFQEVPLMLVTGAGLAMLASLVESLTAACQERKVSLDKKHGILIKSLALEVLETYQQLTQGLGPALFVAISIKSLSTTLACYSVLKRSNSLVEGMQRSFNIANGFVVILYLILVCEDCHTVLQHVPSIIRYIDN
jgi:hypothetical protein